MSSYRGKYEYSSASGSAAEQGGCRVEAWREQVDTILAGATG